mmetsp:Transcript_23929/g.53249  ORF Transcript_23929/g.53249 Transcript_23929/m.53249 type:complete len:239 (+) Transcript_23929:331-1047(+)
MEILDGLSPPLQVAIPRGRVLRKHRMGVDARREHRVVVLAKLGVPSQVGVLVAGPPVVKDPPAAGALKVPDLVPGVEVDARIEHPGFQRVLKARDAVEGVQGPVGADKVGVQKGLFCGHSVAGIEREELPYEVQQKVRRRIESDSQGIACSKSAMEVLKGTRFFYHCRLVQGIPIPEWPACPYLRGLVFVGRHKDAKIREPREVEGIDDLLVGRPCPPELVGQQRARPLVDGKDVRRP